MSYSTLAHRLVRPVAGALICVMATLAYAQSPPTPAGYQAFELRHTDAAKVAPQLRTLLDGNAGQGEILVDRQANRILLRGSSEAQQLAGEFLRALDKPPVSGGPSATRVANKIKAYPIAADALESTGKRLRSRYENNPQVRVVIDTRTRQLIIAAPQDIHLQLATELSGQPKPELPGLAGPAGPAVAAAPFRNQSHALRNVSWREFEDNVQRIWGGSVSLTTARNGELALVQIPSASGPQTVMQIDRRQDEVSFQGTPQTVRSWQQVTRALDSPRREPAAVVPVRKADPNTVQRAVSLLQNASAAVPLGNERARWGGDLVSRIFQNPPADGNLQPNQGQPDPGQAQPGEAEPGLPDVPPVDEQAGVIGPVQIEYVEGLGVFIVRGNKRDVARVMSLIEEIQRQSDVTRPVTEVRQLRFANSAAVAELLTELYEPIFEPRQGPLSITSLDKPNAVLLVGRSENVRSALEMISKLDRPIDPSTQLQVFQLKQISAIDAETTVRNFFVDRPGGGDEPRPGLGIRTRVIADYRSNSLIVQAAPRDMAEVSWLIEKIDVESSEATTEVRVITLKNALAADLVTVLREAITGQQLQQAGQPQAGVGATQAQASRRSTNVSILGIDREGNRIIQSGILTDVTISAEPNVNAVLVRAPSKSMDLITELIRQLDQPPEAQAQIKVFQIENGDATTLTAMLQELFGQQVTAGQGTLGQAFNLQRASVQAFAGAGGEGSLIPLRFAVDVRSNSIVAAGSTADLGVVEILLLRLDEGDIETRNTQVFFLQNAPANDVALAIQTFLSNQRAITQQLFTFQAVSPFEQIDREVIVVAEPVTNSLIVSATPRYYEQVVKIIQDLDFRPPMVMVQVVIAEVALDDVFELGVELGLQDSLLFDRGLQSVGFNFPASPLGNDLSAASFATREPLAGQALSSFGLGRSSGNAGYGGLVLSAANESINVLIRALQDQGRMQILARPQIMTLDNEPAFVQVGERVSRITDTNLTPQGGSQNSFTDINTGLLLSIRPRVNNEDVVVMTLDTEKSSIEDTGVTVAPGIVSPNISTQTAQTTVSARSGQTIVFAGLITKQRSVQTRGVPFVSNIPVLGRLFRFDSEITRRSELLIFMTPHVVRSAEDAERLNFVESDRMSWCLADVVELHGEAGLSGGHGLWGPETTPTIYPDFQPHGEVLHGAPHGHPVHAHPPLQPAGRPAPSIEPAAPGNARSGSPQPARVQAASPSQLRAAGAVGPIPPATPANYQAPWSTRQDQPAAGSQGSQPPAASYPQGQQPGYRPGAEQAGYPPAYGQPAQGQPSYQPELQMLPQTR